MISFRNAKRYCRDDISKIENYELAVSDPNETWALHHRDEVKTLPSGITVIRKLSDLKEAGRYYACPSNELIFLTKYEHGRVHGKNKTEEGKRKLSESMKGNQNRKGRRHSEETRKKISEAAKGRPSSSYSRIFTKESRKKMSEAAKRRWLMQRKHDGQQELKGGFNNA